MVRAFRTAHIGIQDGMVYLQNFGAPFISLVNGGDFAYHSFFGLDK